MYQCPCLKIETKPQRGILFPVKGRLQQRFEPLESHTFVQTDSNDWKIQDVRKHAPRNQQKSTVLTLRWRRAMPLRPVQARSAAQMKAADPTGWDLPAGATGLCHYDRSTRDFPELPRESLLLEVYLQHAQSYCGQGKILLQSLQAWPLKYSRDAALFNTCNNSSGGNVRKTSRQPGMPEKADEYNQLGQVVTACPNHGKEIR